MSRIFGINTISSALDVNRVKKLYISNDLKSKKIFDLKKMKDVEVVYVDKNKLNSLVKGNHQGVVAEVIDYRIYSLNELISSTKTTNPVYAILDELNDPHNLGAILRSADIFGIDGIIYKKRNEVKLDSIAAKISSGAINYVKCCEVVNISSAIKTLKENGFWVFGLAGEAKEDISKIYKDQKVAIVIGNEGNGISRLVKENCDLLVKINQFGHVNCLNASNAAAITFYELRRK